MKIEQVRPAVLQVTASTHELAALVAAARWVAEGADGRMPPDAVAHVRKVLEGYDAASRQMAEDGGRRHRGAGQ